MQKIKTQNGITLIALIITIIVMLILVAVTLVITLGENGIIAKARTAKEQQALRQEAENREFSSEYAESKIDAVIGGDKWEINTGDKEVTADTRYNISFSDNIEWDHYDSSGILIAYQKEDGDFEFICFYLSEYPDRPNLVTIDTADGLEYYMCENTESGDSWKYSPDAGDSVGYAPIESAPTIQNVRILTGDELEEFVEPFIEFTGPLLNNYSGVLTLTPAE